MTDRSSQPWAQESTHCTYRFPVALVLLVGAALRLVGLDSWSLWYDEGAVLAVAKSENPMEMLEESRHPPVAFWAFRAWIAAFGEGTSAVRLLPSLLSCASLLLLARLAGRWLSGGASLTAVAVYAVAPFQNWYAHEIAPYAFVELGSLVALNGLEAALARERVAWPPLVSIAAGTALAFGSQYMGFSIGAAVLGASLVRAGTGRTSVKVAGAAVAASFVGGCLWLPWILTKLPRQMATDWGDQANLTFRALAELPIRLLLVDTSVVPTRFQVAGYALGALLWLGILACAWSAVRGRDRSAAVIAAALAAPIGAVLALLLVFPPNLQARYLTPAAPAAALAVAAGLSSLRPSALARALAAAAVLGLSGLTLAQKFQNRREDYRSACAEIEARFRPGDAVFVVTGTPDAFSEGTVRHYFRARPDLLAAIRPARRDIPQLDKVLDRGTRVFVVFRKRPYALAEIQAIGDQCEFVDASPLRFDVQRRTYVKR